MTIAARVRKSTLSRRSARGLPSHRFAFARASWLAALVFATILPISDGIGSRWVHAARRISEGPTQLPEWPGWGGPHGNFTIDSVRLLDKWPEGGPAQRWSRDLGWGDSSILIDNDRLYTMYRPPGPQGAATIGEEEVVIALDASTGRTVWEHRYAAPLAGMQLEYAGPHSTPLLVGDRLFATGSNRQIMALDKRTGEPLWSHDLVEEFKAPLHYVLGVYYPGYNCSPLAYKDTIIVSAGGPGQAIMAFRQDNGQVVWRSGDFPLAPTSPVLITVEGRDQVVIFAGDRVVGLDAATGAQLWSHPHPRSDNANASTPVWSDDRKLLVSSARDGGTRVLEVSATGVKQLWHTNKMRVYYGDVIRVGKYYYGSSGDLGPAFLTAIDAETGEIAWQDRSFARSCLLYADGKFIILDEDGTLGLATVSSEKLTVLARASVMTAISWSVPTLAGTRLYLRDRSTIKVLELGAS